MENDALSGAKFGGGLYLKDFPAKIRVLTLDPMVYNYMGNTVYAFIVWNQTDQKPQILAKGPGFAKRFQEIHMDEDFGANVRRIDIKITTNGKSGMETRYTITPIGVPQDLANDQIQEASSVNLEDKIKEKNPGALRLSQINAGEQLAPSQSQELTSDEMSEMPEDFLKF